MKQDTDHDFSAGLILELFKVFCPFAGGLSGLQIYTRIQIFNHVTIETDGMCQRKIQGISLQSFPSLWFPPLASLGLLGV